MSITTKFDIGDEVWFSIGRRPRNGYVEHIETEQTECGIARVRYWTGLEHVALESELYPTREACEAAMKEVTHD